MRTFLAILAALLLPSTPLRAAPRLNILFFTADDMNFDSSGICGGPIKDLTPHLDRLAAGGLRFQYAYSTVAVCQPVRQIMQIGLYEQNLVRFIKQLRKDFDAPNAKFVLATLGEATEGIGGNEGKVIEAQFAVDGNIAPAPCGLLCLRE